MPLVDLSILRAASTTRAEAAAVFRLGPVVGVLGPSVDVTSWLLDTYGDDGRPVLDLACLVYRRRGWFRADLDPFALRDRRSGQHEIRVLATVDGAVVPLMAIDLAPVLFAGTWDELDQSRSNDAASLLEIARVSGDQRVRIEGRPRRLGDVPLGAGTVWEASRLGSVTELLKVRPTAEELALPPVAAAHRAATAFTRLPRPLRRTMQDDARALFALALACGFARLPVDLVVGLSQGPVVAEFTRGLVGGDHLHYGALAIGGWHDGAPAFQYAPGYFATGQVVGYSLDGVGLGRDLRAAALAHLHADPVAQHGPAA